MKILKNFILLILTIMFSTQLFSQTSSQKANYIISIARNVEWPENMRETTFKLAVYGSFELYRELIGELMD